MVRITPTPALGTESLGNVFMGEKESLVTIGTLASVL